MSQPRQRTPKNAFQDQEKCFLDAMENIWDPSGHFGGTWWKSRFSRFLRFWAHCGAPGGPAGGPKFAFKPRPGRGRKCKAFRGNRNEREVCAKFRNPQNHHWAAENANQRLIEGSLKRYCTISFHRQRCLQKCASLLHGTAETKARLSGKPGFWRGCLRNQADGQRTLFLRPTPPHAGNSHPA